MMRPQIHAGLRKGWRELQEKITMGEPSPNGLQSQISGLEKLMNAKHDSVACEVQGLKTDLKCQTNELKVDLRSIRDNDIPHIYQEIKELRGYLLKIMGGIAALWAAIQVGVKLIIK